MSEWKSLSSITSKIGSGSTPRGGNSVYSDSGISFIRSQNVLDMDFSTENLAFINDSQAEKLNNVIVEKNDILLNITGDSIARCTVVPEEILPARVNQHVSIIRCKNTEESKYVMYYLQYMKKYLLQISKVGGTRNALTKEAIGKLPIKISDDCNKISKILDNIDQKIQINNQINQELEAMAKTLYDYWFVQFDFPDQNGKPYKSSGGKMIYHPELKREIPEGWGVARIEDIAQTGSGGTPKSTNVSYYSNGEIPWINSGELEQTVITSTSNFITEEGLNNSSAKLFPSGTILVAMYGATAGKVSFLTFEASTNQAICAIILNDIRMRYYLKNVVEDLYQYLVKLSTGSARDNLSQDMIKNIKVVIDSNNYKDKREEALRDLARKKGKKVLDSGRNVKLNPMSARERKIIHEEISFIKGLKTESVGEEPKRYLVIKRIKD